MITCKIGGSSVTPRNLYHIKDILTPHHGCVVVSAIGKEFRGDVKVTDLLIRYRQTQDGDVWRAVSDKYIRLCRANAIDIDVERLLYSARQRALKTDMRYCMSLGEELSAKCVAAYLGAAYGEAEQLVRFSRGRVDRQQTYRNIAAMSAGCKLFVMGGFYGGSADGRRTFSRGGGDISGALAAAATDSTLYENWTDVSGVCVADPMRVHGAATVPSLSYGEMLRLSRAGAEVLHPDAIAPVRDKAIPIRIGNFCNPFGASTLVGNCPSDGKLLSVAERADEAGRYVITVLHGCTLWQMGERVTRFLRSCTRQSEFAREVYTQSVYVYSVESAPGVLRITTDAPILAELYGFLVDD